MQTAQSSIAIERARAKLAIFFKCVLKTTRKKKRAYALNYRGFLKINLSY